MNKTRILLADDHQLFRAGLKAILERQPGLEVIGEAIDGQSALQLAAKHHPDIILLDISMPGLNGLEALRRLRSDGTASKVIILSMHSDRHYVTESFRAGARGFVLKDSALEELVESIRMVQSGSVYLSGRIAGIVLEDYVALASESEPQSSELSGREREVLQLIAEGRSTKEAAAHLCLSVKTIETHRKRIMDKLDLHSVAELTRYAIRERIIPGD
jgi:two-component system response regulator NreC